MTTKTEYIRSSKAALSQGAQLGLFRLPRRREFLLAHVGQAPKRILDVGCATGYVALMLMKLGHEVTGIELNQKMASSAKAKGVHVIEQDLEEPLSLPSASVDVVHACEIIEHLFDTEGFLHEIHRVLSPNGTVILSTPNLNSLMNRFRVLFGLPLPMWGAFPQDRHGSHVRVFNRLKITQLLQRTKFQPEVITGINQSHLAPILNHLPTLSEMLLIKAVRKE